MVNGERRFGFRIDRERLEEMCVAAYASWDEGIRRYLPQWNLPPELEHDPIQDSPKDPEWAARFLLVEASFERMTKSSAIIGNALRTWENPKKRWIFNPSTVARMPLEDIKKIINEDFQFALQSRGERPPEERFRHNAHIISDRCGNDPRNLVVGKTVEEARKGLVQFQGIGSGIANLYILYLLDRGIAFPTDPLNALLKVDVHKGRLPIQCEAVIPTNHEIPRDEAFEGEMERRYHEVCERRDMSAVRLDSVLWFYGSERCTKKDYGVCVNGCPLVKMCQGYTPENKLTGRYEVIGEDGKRKDGRRNRSQGMFRFGAMRGE